jgi:uncharacterized protein YukJ
MSLKYGFVKCTLTSAPVLKASRRKKEIQYHLHAGLQVGDRTWDTAINVGTNDSDDLLLYRLAFDFHHPIVDTLRAAPAGFTDLTDTDALPALDFLRSDVLAETGKFRETDVMDGSLDAEPIPSLIRMLKKALAQGSDVYIFGRTYSTGDGIHDIHMNQGSSAPFIHREGDDRNDHNDVWQDGAVLVDFKDPANPEMAAYFTAFTQQDVPTDDLGNPLNDSHGMTDADPGTLAQA